MNIFKKLYLAHKYRKFNDGYIIIPKYEECGSGKGADIWGTDWPIPVAEEFEWHFYDDTNTGNQYITTKLTDYILWFIPFTYDEYIYELPSGKFKHGELTTKMVADMIYFLEHWNWHTDEVYNDRTYCTVEIWGNPNMKYTIGDNDFDFIRHK